MFSEELLIKLFDEFFDFKEQFTIRKLDQISVIGRKTASYNRMMDELNKSLLKGEKKRSYLNENRIKMIVMLMQNNTVDELVKEGVISPRSKYNYLRTIRIIGINKNAILDVDIESCLDHVFYYQIIRGLRGNHKSFI